VLSYLTIFASSLCGYTGMPLWTLGAVTLALTSISASESYWLYKRGAELGLSRQVDETLLKSLFNAFCGAAAAYLCGVIVRLASGL
jgi:hypothetical protein